MTIEEWLHAAQGQLEQAKISTPRLDALVLLSDELGHDKSWVIAHPEYVLQRSEIKNLSTKIAQRCQHIPLAYIREKTEFYGREFTVSHDVLVPRPESESMIELLIQHLAPRTSPTIIDIGTGSGVLAITAALTYPQAEVVATDIAGSALAVAQANAEHYQIAIHFMQGNLLQAVDTVRFGLSPLVFLANLPYVPDNYPINKAAAHEPPLALFAGSDGLVLYKKLCAQISILRRKPDFIITESLCMQHEKLAQLMSTVGYSLQDTNGLAQFFGQDSH